MVLIIFEPINNILETLIPLISQDRLIFYFSLAFHSFRDWLLVIVS